MLKEALLTYLHFISIFILVSAVIVQRVLFTRQMRPLTMIRVAKADKWYGIATGLVIITGVLKLFLYGKGSDYYLNNHIFWTKIILFGIMGLLSIYPTVKFMKLKKEAALQSDISLDYQQYQVINISLWCEVIVLCLIPLCASFMARGFGLNPS